MKTTLLIVGLCVFGMHARSQNIKTSTVSWYATQAFDITIGKMTVVADTIVSVNTSEVEWKRADGTSQIFAVSEVIGQWTNINHAGEIVYEAANGTTRGTVTFERSEGNTRIRFMMMTEEVPSFYELTVSSYQVNE